MITLYGIPNCDTIRKARRWLDERGVDYRFHDFRKDGLERDQLQAWVDELGWETLLNKRGLMWRRLPEEKKADLDEKREVALLLEELSGNGFLIIESGLDDYIGAPEYF